MSKFSLRKYQKDDTFNLVQKHGLNPLKFRWGTGTAAVGGKRNRVPVLRYIGTDFYFQFDRNVPGNLAVTYCPSPKSWVVGPVVTGRWDVVLSRFDEWLSSLQKEMTPDLWEQLKEYTPSEAVLDTSDMSNAPFSHLEAERVATTLEKLQKEIEKSFGLQGEQLDFVKKQLDYLKDGAKRQGRKDWVHTSIGVVVGIAVNLALSPDKAKVLWDLVRSCFAGILQLPAP